MKFNAVDPDEIPSMREGRRGRVSYPILKSFMETGIVCAQLDRTGMQQSFQSLYSSLSAYIRSHELPIKLFSRGGQIYLLRLDLNPDGSSNPEWREELAGLERADSVPITAGEVAQRFQEEKDKVTK